MIVYSIFSCLNIDISFYNKIFIWLLFLYLLINLIVYSSFLLKHRKKNKYSKQNAIRISSKDILNIVSLIIYLFANKDLVDHTVESSLHHVVGLLIFLIIAALSNIEDELENNNQTIR